MFLEFSLGQVQIFRIFVVVSFEDRLFKQVQVLKLARCCVLDPRARIAFHFEGRFILFDVVVDSDCNLRA
jgi:hypothetical protein